MELSLARIEEFRQQGYLLLPTVFSAVETARIKAELPVLFGADGPNRILEKDGRFVRSVYGCHRTNELCDQLTRHPRLLRPAEQLLGSSVYVHQFKINAKVAFGGDQWEWHQDFIFWRNEDRMVTDRVVNIAVFLDDVTEFNGPILLLPGSHREGVVETGGTTAGGMSGGPGRSDAEPPPWLSHLTKDLKYSLDIPTMKTLVSRWGIEAPKGPAGSILFFHPNVVHGSPPNMSPFDRAMAIVTFNSIENRLPPSPSCRPDFLASRDFSPLMPVADDVWTRAAVGV